MISLIIPTFNRIHWLKKCLFALCREVKNTKCEIIVIDDGSTDGTRNFLDQFHPQPNIRFLVFDQNRGGPAKARNLGVRMSQGNIVCFLDDDSIVQPGWLDQLNKSFDAIDNNFAAVKGMVYAYQDGSLPKFLEKYIHISDSWATNNIAFVKELFIKAAGFDEEFTFAAWEDLDLGYRLEKMGYKRFYNERMAICHPHEENIEQLKKKFKINGYGYYQFCRKWIDIDPKWIISMWLERIRVLYYLLPGMEYLDYLRYIHGLRIRYEISGMMLGIFTRGRIASKTKDN
jgi:GT2 family glycosyltransferase